MLQKSTIILLVFPLPLYAHGLCFLCIQFSDYHKIVEAFGAKGFILDCTNEDQIEAIFKQAQAENKQGNSVLINCLIGKSTFREGSISV
jgi:acetolactate synthase-like protein